MAWKWNNSYDEDENKDWLTVRNGPIIKYFSEEVLGNNVKELEKIGYQIIEISTMSWTKGNAHKKIQEGFDFPDYYGENINAFKDCLDDKFNKKYKGLVVVFKHFDSFYQQSKDFSEALLDVIVKVAWTWLLAEQKLILFVHSTNPNLIIDKVGGFEPDWNGEEWFNDSRN
ncbi:barstar family protein [Maribacter sp. 2-571]|uniref:barstar family protein n=1 Tax=Maribacter sp. 2-571 TaxID=3417569 RepID=UPI003D342DC3